MVVAASASRALLARLLWTAGSSLVRRVRSSARDVLEMPSKKIAYMTWPRRDGPSSDRRRFALRRSSGVLACAAYWAEAWWNGGAADVGAEWTSGEGVGDLCHRSN